LALPFITVVVVGGFDGDDNNGDDGDSDELLRTT
jgi:hypothetical protein